MNFYDHHIRDYDAATAHLTWDEDMAYSRLIRWYYRKEKPIPADIAEACRQVRATSKVHRDAVESVLREFFVLEHDGWHKDTCDAVIAQYQAGQPEREAKKQNEDTRLARHRAERAGLFGAINAAGQHLPYNAPIAEVRALAERIRNGAVTAHATLHATHATAHETPKNASATQPATGTATPATATHSPLPTTQYPTRRGKSRASAAPPPSQPDDVDPEVWADWLALRAAKKAPVTGTVIDGARKEAGKADMPLEEFLRAWCTNGTQGFRAAWIKPRDHVHSNGQQSFREIDEVNAAARAAKWDPTVAARPTVRPASSASNSNIPEVIDVTAIRLG